MFDKILGDDDKNRESSNSNGSSLGDDNDSNSTNAIVEKLKAKGRSDVEIINDNSRIFRDDKVQSRFLFVSLYIHVLHQFHVITPQGLFDFFSDEDEEDDCITAPSAATSTQPASISISSSAPTTTLEVTTPSPTNGTRSKTNF